MKTIWRYLLIGLSVFAVSERYFTMDIVQIPLSELVEASNRIARVRVVNETRIVPQGSEASCTVYDVEVIEALKGSSERFRFAEVTPPPSAAEYLVFAWKYSEDGYPTTSGSDEDELALCSRSSGFPGVVTRPNIQTMIPLEPAHSRNPDRLWLVADRPSAVSSLPFRREITPSQVRDYSDWGLAREKIVLLVENAESGVGK